MQNIKIAVTLDTVERERERERERELQSTKNKKLNKQAKRWEYYIFKNM